MNDIYPKRAANLAARVIQGEAIIMNPADSRLFNLNETATMIWLAADGTCTLREIVERDICPNCEIDLASALRDAGEFAQDLAAHAILTLSSERSAERAS